MKSLLLTKKANPGYNIKTLMDKKSVKGDVGIEIEMEGFNFIKDNTSLKPFWCYHNDGSLRGEDNAEYVLIKPIPFSKVPEAVNTLWDKLKQNNVSIDESNRTSVHVHLNCQNFHLNRLTSFAALYFCLEEVLTEWCGEHRVGNLFCLRAKDAPGIISSLKNFITSNGDSNLSSSLHYANFNANALSKFGSIEIRSMRGATSPEPVVFWVEVLERLYTLSETFPDPRDICGLFSQQGPLDFFESLLGDLSVKIRQDLNLSDDEIKNSMYEGIRLAQDLCYCRDWGLYKPISIEEDPFKRSPKLPNAFSNPNTTPILDAYLPSYSPTITSISSSYMNSNYVSSPPPLEDGENLDLDWGDSEDDESTEDEPEDEDEE